MPANGSAQETGQPGLNLNCIFRVTSLFTPPPTYCLRRLSDSGKLSQVAIFKVEGGTGTYVGPGEIVRAKDDPRYGHHEHETRVEGEELVQRIQGFGLLDGGFPHLTMEWVLYSPLQPVFFRASPSFSASRGRFKVHSRSIHGLWRLASLPTFKKYWYSHLVLLVET